MIIGGNEHPVYFGWLQMEAISNFAKHKSLDTTANDLTNLSGSMEFIREVAFQGVQGGYLKEGKECPFKDSASMVMEAKKFSEIAAAMDIYIKSTMDFYESEEPVDGKKKANP